jgi:hypothetical protein
MGTVVSLGVYGRRWHTCHRIVRFRNVLEDVVGDFKTIEGDWPMAHFGAYEKLLPREKSTEFARRSQRSPSPQLTILLRHFRRRIDGKSAALGPYQRLPCRRGKPVTQEELAEYLGVSRAWYSLLESRKPARVSIVLLDRLSAALMLTREERAKLFALALPELDFTSRSHVENCT